MKKGRHGGGSGGMRGATGVLEGVENKQESSLGSKHAQAPLQAGGGRILSAARIPLGQAGRSKYKKHTKTMTIETHVDLLPFSSKVCAFLFQFYVIF